MWYYAHNAMDNTSLGNYGVVDSIVEWLAVVSIINAGRLAPASSPELRTLAGHMRQDTQRSVCFVVAGMMAL